MQTLLGNPTRNYVTSALLSGTNGVLASFVLLSGVQVLFVRLVITVLALLFVFMITRHRFQAFKHKRAFMLLALSGVFLGANLLFIYLAYDRIGVGLTILLTYCAPVIVMALAPVLFKERLTVRKVIGLATVLFGAVLVNSVAVTGGVPVVGVTLGCLSAIAFAMSTICLKKTQPICGIEIPLWQMLFAFPVIAGYFLVTGQMGFTIRASDIPMLLIIGIVVSTFGAYLGYTSVPKMEAATVSVLGYVEPLFAVMLSAAVLGEDMAPLQIAGIVLMVAGLVFSQINFKPRSLKQPGRVVYKKKDAPASATRAA